MFSFSDGVISIEELAIAISSLVTKILISCSKIDDTTEKALFATAMNIEHFNQALTNYSLFNDDTKLIQCGNEVRELLELLYID